MRYIVTARREDAVCAVCGEATSANPAWYGTHKYGPVEHRFEPVAVTRMFTSMDMAITWSQFMRRAGYETEVQ